MKTLFGLPSSTALVSLGLRYLLMFLTDTHAQGPTLDPNGGF